MNPAQLAATVLRLVRKRGNTLRIEYGGDSAPTLYVSPTPPLTDWLKNAIKLSKRQLIALLEQEGVGQCTAADGTVWRQPLARCSTCGAADWGIVGQEEVRGEAVNVWACLTCQADVQVLEHELHPLLGVAKAATYADAIIVCSRAATRRCVVCRTTRELKLCDFPVNEKTGQTCDRSVCARHAYHEEPDIDYCPEHAQIITAKRG